MRGGCRKCFPSRECGSSEGCRGKQPKQGKAIGAIKDIHQQREESSRARGMLASRAKSESFAYRGGQSRTTGHKDTRKRRRTAERMGDQEAAEAANYRTRAQIMHQMIHDKGKEHSKPLGFNTSPLHPRY